MTKSEYPPQRPRRRGGRPTLESAAALRETLLTRALDIFLVKGFEGASINEIAKSSGVSRDTVYRQFADKEALFLAASRHAFRKMSQHLEDVIRAADPPEEVLRKVIRYIHLDTRDDRSSGVIRLSIMEAYRVPEIRSALLKESFGFLNVLTDYLAQQVAAGLLRIANPAETALLIAVLAAGGGSFFVQYQVADPNEDEQQTMQLVEFILYGLKGSMNPSR